MQSEDFWKQLKEPIIGLSPMDGLTDHPFRHITKKYGNPDLLYTEFTSVEGLCHGAERLLREFLYDHSQFPIVAQIYGTTPAYFRQCAVLLCQLGFSGIDINMGCPAKNVAHSGAGAALIKNPSLAVEIITATQQGVEDWYQGMNVTDCPDLTKEVTKVVLQRATELTVDSLQRKRIPVSVKTRVGFDEPVVDSWIPTLLSTGVSTIALHGRTLKQQYSGSADWELIGKAAEIVRKTETKILGNGDIDSREKALEKCSTYALSGVLIGRAALGNPFIFTGDSADTNIFSIALEHAQLYEETFSSQEKYNFLPMRKHLAWYVRAIPNASQIRTRLVLSQSAAEVATILKDFHLIG
jgi:nifR3 family TIM-barrel protein